MIKRKIITDINLTKQQMYRMNVNSPNYKNLKKHIENLYKELKKYDH